MAVGDVVNGMGAAGVTLNFQPAGSTECMISSVLCVSAWRINITNGVLTPSSVNDATLSNQENIKLFINNTNYLTVTLHASYAQAYSGLQIK